VDTYVVWPPRSLFHYRGRWRRFRPAYTRPIHATGCTKRLYHLRTPLYNKCLMRCQPRFPRRACHRALSHRFVPTGQLSQSGGKPQPVYSKQLTFDQGGTASPRRCRRTRIKGARCSPAGLGVTSAIPRSYPPDVRRAQLRQGPSWWAGNAIDGNLPVIQHGPYDPHADLAPVLEKRVGEVPRHDLGAPEQAEDQAAVI